MGYIIVIARLPGIYGDVNRPCPRATPSDSGRFTAINPWPRAITITNVIMIKFIITAAPAIYYQDLFYFTRYYYGLVDVGLPHLIRNVQCTSHETQLSQCSFRTHSQCGSSLGIKCQITNESKTKNLICDDVIKNIILTIKVFLVHLRMFKSQM